MADDKELIDLLKQQTDREMTKIDMQGMTSHSTINNIQNELHGTSDVNQVVVSYNDKKGCC
ncbi:unnamed protein product [Onchocerca flexuosa]|uniref:DUF4258 domain-containing protein n=1 Tax=Onchocerca flexuosa TaxID=387005 RepID=A0A183HSA5_9BILA|nr:unnamed protein product [Onchocerca flexuosa]